MVTGEAEISYAGGGESGSSFSQNYGGHKVISTYEMELRTDAFDAHYEALVSKAKAMGGYVQYGNVWGTKPEVYGDSGRTAELTFRIPAEQAEAFLTFAEGNGEVVRQSVNTEDVTLDYYDRETRLEVLRAQLDRLQSILVETDNLADIIELEQAISDVTLEIEQMTTQLRRYDDLIDYATVHIYLYEESLIAGPRRHQGLWGAGQRRLPFQPERRGGVPGKQPGLADQRPAGIGSAGGDRPGGAPDRAGHLQKTEE